MTDESVLSSRLSDQIISVRYLFISSTYDIIEYLTVKVILINNFNSLILSDISDILLGRLVEYYYSFMVNRYTLLHTRMCRHV